MKHEHITSKSAGMYCNMFILEALKCDQYGERGIFSQSLKIYLLHLTNWTIKIKKNTFIVIKVWNDIVSFHERKTMSYQ